MKSLQVTTNEGTHTTNLIPTGMRRKQYSCCRQPNSESNAVHLDKYPRLSIAKSTWLLRLRHQTHNDYKSPGSMPPPSKAKEQKSDRMRFSASGLQNCPTGSRFHYSRKGVEGPTLQGLSGYRGTELYSM